MRAWGSSLEGNNKKSRGYDKGVTGEKYLVAGRVDPIWRVAVYLERTKGCPADERDAKSLS